MTLNLTKANIDEIEKVSFLISLFSRIDDSSGDFFNQTAFLGGEGYFEDENARESVKRAFDQLNVPAIFHQMDFTLEVALYLPFKLKEDLKISPNMWIVNSKVESVYAMHLILAIHSEINISSLYKELNELVTDYAGTVIRTEIQGLKKNASLEISISPELQEASDLLHQHIYHRLFFDCSLSGSQEKPTKHANLVTIMIQEATVNRRWIHLSTNRLYSQKEKNSLAEEVQGKLQPSTPFLTIANCWFIFPSALQDPYKDYHAPFNLRNLFEASFMPSPLKMAYLRINPETFQEILHLPAKSIFSYSPNSDDFISMFSHHRKLNTSGKGSTHENEKNEVKIQIVTGISDSKMQGEEFFSEMAMRIIIRDIEDGFKHGRSIENIFSTNMQLQSWRSSITYMLNDEHPPEGLKAWDKIELRNSDS